MRIGSVKLASNLFLCPIAGYCDLAFRKIVRPLGGLAMAYTDLVSPKGLKRQTPRSLQIVKTDADDQPLGIQLYGSEAAELAEAAAWAAENGATIVDINMGCPVPKVAGKGGGSGLLRNCPNAVAIAAAVVKACPKPVTVKTRLGWFLGDLVAPELAKQFRDVGVAALTIHGRYGEQKFSGSVDLAGISAVVEAVPDMAVIGNGDVRSPTNAARMFETGCAGVMIGRRALADQWIFRDTAAYLATGAIPAPPTRKERTLKMIEHFRGMIAELGERRAVIEFRKRISWHVKTIGPCPKLRRAVPYIQEASEFDDLVGEFLNELDQSGDADIQADRSTNDCELEPAY